MLLNPLPHEITSIDASDKENEIPLVLSLPFPFSKHFPLGTPETL